MKLTTYRFITIMTQNRACGATICHRTDELREEDIGTEAGLFEIRKIGDE